MRREYGERGHRGDRYRIRNSRSERRSEERYSSFSLASRGEEFALEELVSLRCEEWGSAKRPSTIWALHLVIQQPLNVLNGQKMLAVHRNDDSVPNLRY